MSFMQRLADFCTVLLSFAFGYFIYLNDKSHYVPYSFVEFFGLGAAAGLIFVVIFQASRLYERETSLLNVVETRRLFVAWIFGSLVLFSATFYFRVLDLSRVMVTVSLATSLVLFFLERAIFYRIHIWVNAKGGGHRTAVIYGAGVVGKHLLKRIYHSPALGISVVGFLDDDEKLWGKEIILREIHERRGTQVLGGVDKLPSMKERYGLSEVFIAMPTASYQRNLEVAQMCRSFGLSVSVVPPTYGSQMHYIDVQEIGGIPVLREKNIRPYFLYPFLKRGFDLTVASIAIFLLSPVMILLAVLVKLDSPGPILFRQRRVGLDGQEFDFFKIRSMHSNANPYALTPRSADDPRITKFGRWLRRSSLDELPQFFNVIKGDMSIVGPRPEMPFIVSQYNEEQRERLKVKPGITGVWQISAVRGEPIHANMEYDLFYIENQSFLLDVIIMIKTVITAIRGIGAV